MLELLWGYIPHIRDLAVSYVLAFPIGLDRERQENSAGLRTFPLVAIASCGFVQASERLLTSAEGKGALLQGLITGIGFIGGGAILQQGREVRGTATAASLWATGAIGMAVGLGSYDVAVVIAVFTFLTLWMKTPFKRRRPDSPPAGQRIDTNGCMG